MKRKTKHTTTQKDMLKTAVLITGFELSKIFELLKIKDVQSFANKVKLFNFVLKYSTHSDYLQFTLDYKHLIYTN